VCRCEPMASADEVLARQLEWRIAARAEGWREKPA
jgi:hypothetical protein